MKHSRVHRFGMIGTIALMAMLLVSGCGNMYPVLDPAGPVGRQELHLIILSTILVFVVIVPVLILLVYILMRFRDKPGNQAPYKPNWADSKTLEVIWWGIPIIIVGVLGTVTAKTTFSLTRPPEKSVKPLTIQVTSLDWKWLFQYPGQNIATVNYAEIPTGVPVQFELTADAPMNSFWVPQLGGQEYTMPGMSMRLWLQANKVGTYYGHGANFTGKGFAHMQFSVVATSDKNFNHWVNHLKLTAPKLTSVGYDKLKQPGVVGKLSYSAFPKGLFNDTVWADGGKYMPGMPGMNGMKSAIGSASTTDKASSSKPGSSSISATTGMSMKNGQ